MQIVDFPILEDLKSRYNHLLDAQMILQFFAGFYPSLPPGITLENVRDALSSGQVLSKFWLLDQIKKSNIFKENPAPSILVAGGWLGVNAYFLHKTFNAQVLSLDIDPQCNSFVEYWCAKWPAIKATTADMYQYDYSSTSYDLIVNTSCEHITDLPKWIRLLKPGQKVILQSNDFSDHRDHVNSIHNLEDFKTLAGLSKIHDANELKFRMYNRYMIYGQV